MTYFAFWNNNESGQSYNRATLRLWFPFFLLHLLLVPFLLSFFLSLELSSQYQPMGNALRLLFGNCCKPETDPDSARPHATDPGVSALAHDLYNYEITSLVPEGLNKYVVSSKKAQGKWYKKLSVAWRESKPPPKTPEEASRLVIQTLSRNQKADVEGLLAFYGLPLPHTLLELTTEVPTGVPHGLLFEFQTLPVDVRAVADGDTVTVYVSTMDPRESSSVPRDVLVAAVERSEARAVRNYSRADALQEQMVESGYRVINIQGEEILARKYRIRLRGIDAPEGSMPYGKEAKEELAKIIQGKCLRVLVFDQDQYGRHVGDIYCNGIFVQESMLKMGMAWHYKAYDRRPELDKWEREARAKRVGLWAASNPEMPWEWRKDRREGR